ncbi:MAG: hypothetical protein JRD89_08755 [Deltaproteobacteria bacterium]|nr:hypothetical protein [Deltaproteobacteria bacterium]
MAKKSYEPSIDEILDLDAQTDSIYSRFHSQLEEDERFYEMDIKDLLQIPDEFRNMATVLPTPRMIVDTWVDNTDITNASITASVVQRGKEPSEAEIEAAEIRRLFAAGLVYMTNINQEIAPWMVSRKHFWLHGLTAFRVLYNADAWPTKPRVGGDGEVSMGKMQKYEQDKLHANPIDIRAVSPYWIKVDPSIGEPSFVIEKTKNVCLEVKKRYPYWSNPEGKEIQEDVEHIFYCDRDFYCNLFDGEPVLRGGRGRVIPHGYGFLPYVVINSGLGNISCRNDMSMRYVGMLRHIRDLLVAQSRLFSKMDILTSRNIWPWLEGRNLGDATIETGLGKVNFLPQGAEIIEHESKMPPAEAGQLLQFISGMCADFGAPPALRGTSEEGVRSAADRRFMYGQAGARLRNAADAYKYRIAKVLEMAAEVFERKVPDDIRIYSCTPTDNFDRVIKKEQMKGPYNYAVNFQHRSPEDEYREHDDQIRQKAAGLISREYIWQRRPDVDAKAMRKQILKERIEDSPALANLIQQYLAVKGGDIMGRRLAAEGIAAGLPPPPVGPAETPPPGGGRPPMGPMTTPIPNRAVPGGPEEMQNILRAGRSQEPRSATQGRGGGGARGAQR